MDCGNVTAKHKPRTLCTCVCYLFDGILKKKKLIKWARWWKHPLYYIITLFTGLYMDFIWILGLREETTTSCCNGIFPPPTVSHYCGILHVITWDKNKLNGSTVCQNLIAVQQISTFLEAFCYWYSFSHSSQYWIILHTHLHYCKYCVSFAQLYFHANYLYISGNKNTVLLTVC